MAGALRLQAAEHCGQWVAGVTHTLVGVFRTALHCRAMHSDNYSKAQPGTAIQANPCICKGPHILPARMVGGPIQCT